MPPVFGSLNLVRAPGAAEEVAEAVEGLAGVPGARGVEAREERRQVVAAAGLEERRHRPAAEERVRPARHVRAVLAPVADRDVPGRVQRRGGASPRSGRGRGPSRCRTGRTGPGPGCCCRCPGRCRPSGRRCRPRSRPSRPSTVAAARPGRRGAGPRPGCPRCPCSSRTGVEGQPLEVGLGVEEVRARGQRVEVACPPGASSSSSRCS